MVRSLHANADRASPANTLGSSQFHESTHRARHERMAAPFDDNVPASPPHMSPTLPPQPGINADLIAAIASALGPALSNVPVNAALMPTSRKFFSRVITNTTSKLPIAVIKELRSGFKNYIPLSLCTHKACLNATRSGDAFDTEIGMNDKGEIRMKQKTLTAAKDYSLSTDDFTEICENFTRGMRKYLIFGDDIQPGCQRALDCTDMFQEFFSIIAARPDYTQDWPAY
ncbi:hypothetical protein BYT27DRAFT_7217303 [Phlegmacium glaucopus]|nr:hypothetical protein BYT27DRAFT_7217303 [Phlegmacium glaucopus]